MVRKTGEQGGVCQAIENATVAKSIEKGVSAMCLSDSTAAIGQVRKFGAEIAPP
jgi:hypothetical protein